MKNKLLAPLIAAVVLIASCGGDDDDIATDTTSGDATETTAGGDGASEVTVQVDGSAGDFNAAFLAYFPDSVTVHPGDTIVYESNFSGEPHSIAFGTDVTAAIEAFRSLTPEQLEAEGPPPPELEAAFEKIPPMLPEGPGDAIQSSVNPCFIDSGEVPEDPTEMCEVTEPEPFTGEEAFYNSGFLADGETFELVLADDIAPGTYAGFCTLHFVEMISEVTVVPAGEEIPSADEVADEGQAQLDALIEALAPAAEIDEDEVDPGTVMAGAGSEEIKNALVAEFLPGEVEVAAGDEVTWAFVGPHTVSFNVSEEARVLISRGDDGAYHLNGEALAPAGFEPPPPPEGEPEGPPPPIEGGTWDGTGTFSSGIAFDGFSMTFSEPGTYDYICLIHPDMEGTVKVS